MEKDLNYYMDNPDELDEEALASVMDEKPPEKEEEEIPEAAEEEKPSEEEEEEEKAPDGVYARDGKHIIPFSVLEAEREQKNALVDTVRELQEEFQGQEERSREEIEQMTARLQELEGRLAASEKDSVTGGLDEAKFREEYGDELADAIFNTMRGMSDKVASLTEQLSKHEEAIGKVGEYVIDASTKDQSQTVASIQEAIDAVPAIAMWQSSDPEMWERARALDDALADNDPEYGKMSYEDQFRYVARILKAPEDSLQSQKPDKGEKDVEKKVKAKLDEAEERAPLSHSDLGGGDAPATLRNIENMSPFELADKFGEMDSKAMDAFIKAHGL